MAESVPIMKKVSIAIRHCAGLTAQKRACLGIAAFVIVGGLAALAFGGGSSATKTALREFGFDGHRAIDCSQPARDAPFNAHYYYSLGMFSASYRIEVESSTRVPSGSKPIGAIVKAAIVSNDKMVMERETMFTVFGPEHNSMPQPTISRDVIKKIDANRTILIESLTTGVGVMDGDLNGNSHPMPIKKGEHFQFYQVRSGINLSGTLPPLTEKCRD
jgi:hypothetical protein